jgi:hypothetical protein
MQQVLLLRAELDAVLEVARRTEVSPIVLKGGAVLPSDSTALWAKDLDLLLARHEAQRLVEALDRAGWRRHGGGSPSHFAERVREGHPPVEIHTADGELLHLLGPRLLARAREHPDQPGLRLLHPVDQVRHVAIHQTVEHPSHRGRLRDLSLLVTALTDPGIPVGADPGEGGPAPVREILAMASDIRDRRPVADPFRGVAALWYAMDREARGARRSTPARVAAIWAFDLDAGDGSFARHWRLAWRPRLDSQSWWRPVDAVARRNPGLGGRLRTLVRAIWLPPVIAWGWLTSRRRRRQATEALAALDRGGDGRP